MKNQIVIVEDDKEIREGVEIYLRSQGYTEISRVLKKYTLPKISDKAYLYNVCFGFIFACSSCNS